MTQSTASRYIVSINSPGYQTNIQAEQGMLTTYRIPQLLPSSCPLLWRHTLVIMAADVLQRCLFGKPHSILLFFQLLCPNRGHVISVPFSSSRSILALFLLCRTLEAVANRSIDSHSSKGLPSTDSLLLIHDSLASFMSCLYCHRQSRKYC